MTSVLGSLIADRPGEPGLAAALMRGGQVAERRCVGLADLAHRVPIGPGTRFHIVSASKTFVAASILILAAQGALSLDDPVWRHLPEMPSETGAVSLRHLLSMTSGLRDVLEIERLRGEWRPSPSRVQDLLGLSFRQTRMSAPAGTQYMYANVNYVLLEEIVRRLTGDADAFRREVLYRPLGLSATRSRPHEGIVLPDLATPYIADGNGGWVRGTELLGTSGDTLTTSLDDLSRWVLALGAGRIGGVDVRGPMATPGRLNDGRLIHYGLGLCIRPYRGLIVLGHTGSQPGYKTHLAYVPDRDLGVAILSNREDTRPGALAAAIIAAALGDEGFPAPHPAKRARPAMRMPAISGTYVDPETGEWMVLTLGDDGVLAGETLGDALWLYPDGDGVFRHGDDYRADTPAELAFSFGPTPDDVSCRIDCGGRVSRMVKHTAPVYAPADLVAFAGVYESDEIASRHRVTLGETGLAVTYGLGFDQGRTFPMEPVAPDIFLVRPTAPGVAHRHVFRFERAADGTVIAAIVTMDRLKEVVLPRTGDA